MTHCIEVSGTESSPAYIDCIGTYHQVRYWHVCGSSSGMTTQNHHLLRDTATCFGDATGRAFDGTTLSPCPWSETPYGTALATWTPTGNCFAMLLGHRRRRPHRRRPQLRLPLPRRRRLLLRRRPLV